jgi:hypothetical protein
MISSGFVSGPFQGGKSTLLPFFVGFLVLKLVRLWLFFSEPFKAWNNEKGDCEIIKTDI